MTANVHFYILITPETVNGKMIGLCTCTVYGY